MNYQEWKKMAARTCREIAFFSMIFFLVPKSVVWSETFIYLPFCLFLLPYKVHNLNLFFLFCTCCPLLLQFIFICVTECRESLYVFGYSMLAVLYELLYAITDVDCSPKCIYKGEKLKISPSRRPRDQDKKRLSTVSYAHRIYLRRSHHYGGVFGSP